MKFFLPRFKWLMIVGIVLLFSGCEQADVIQLEDEPTQEEFEAQYEEDLAAEEEGVPN